MLVGTIWSGLLTIPELHVNVRVGACWCVYSTDFAPQMAALRCEALCRLRSSRATSLSQHAWHNLICTSLNSQMITRQTYLHMRYSTAQHPLAPLHYCTHYTLLLLTSFQLEWFYFVLYALPHLYIYLVSRPSSVACNFSWQHLL